MQDSRPDVGQIIERGRRSGRITDTAQASKSIAGNGFQALIAYSLIRLQEAGVLNPDLMIVLKPNR